MFFDLDTRDNSDKCPNPTLPFWECKKFTPRSLNKSLSTMAKNVVKTKKFKPEKVEVMPVYKPKLKVIDSISNITVSFKYKCLCGELNHLFVTYLGNVKVIRECPKCNRRFDYKLLLKKDNDFDYGFQTKLEITLHKNPKKVSGDNDE